jgi:hypothetical protein
VGFKQAQHFIAGGAGFPCKTRCWVWAMTRCTSGR